MQLPILNRILRSLPSDDRVRLAPMLHPVAFEVRDVLIKAGAPLEHCYFIERGLISVVMQVGTVRVEVGMIGLEGVVCASAAVLEGRWAAHEHVAQIAGSARGIALTDLRAAMRDSPALDGALRRAVRSELFQARHTAFVNASFGTGGPPLTLSADARDGTGRDEDAW